MRHGAGRSRPSSGTICSPGASRIGGRAARGRRARGLAVVWALGLASGACLRVHEIHVYPGAPEPVVGDPGVIGEGDSVKIWVHDRVYGNRYVGSASSTDLASINRALVFGGTGLEKVANWFSLAKPTPPAADDGAGTPAGPVSDFVPTDSATRPRSELEQALDARDEAYQRASALRDRAVARTSDVAALVRERPELVPVLGFLSNRPLHQLAIALADDGTPRTASERLTALSRDASISLPPDTLTALVWRGRDFAARLEALSRQIPPNVAPDDPQVAKLAPMVADVDSLLREFRTQLTIGAGRQAEAERIARATGASDPRLAATPPPPPQLVVFGSDLTMLGMDSPSTLTDLHVRLATVQENARRLAAALSLLPRWTRAPVDSAVVFEREFSGDKEVTLSILRQPRFGTFTVASEPAGKGTSTQADADADSGSASPAVQAPTLAEAVNDTVAKIRLEVFPRYRFHLTAGAMYSPMRRRDFTTVADTADGVAGMRIQETGKATSQLLPVGMISYVLFPTEGKIFARQAYGKRPMAEQLGLELQAGASLQHPTEDAFVGLATEPFPGVDVGVGMHFAHVDQPAAGYRAGDLVPDSAGAPVVKVWRRRIGLSVTVDASTFAQTIAGLFK